MDNELLVIRTSERTAFARCRQRWYWAYRDRLTPREVKPALRFGSLIHEALAAYYKPSTVRSKIIRGPHPATTFNKLYVAQLQEFEDFGMYTEEEEWQNARDLGVEMLTNYIDHYGKDERYRIVQPEFEFQLDLWNEQEEYICTYVGTFDAIVEDMTTQKYGLFEHKTAKTIKTNHLILDEQAGSYWAFAPYVLADKLLPKLDFVLYNFLRKGKKDERQQNEDGYFLNQDGSISKRQPSPLFHREIVRRSDKERENTMRRVDAQALEIAYIDEGELSVWKTPTKDCSWDCDFFDMCCLHESGADWEGYRDATMIQWNPYEGHTEHLEDVDNGV